MSTNLVVRIKLSDDLGEALQAYARGKGVILSEAVTALLATGLRRHATKARHYGRAKRDRGKELQR